MSINSNKLEKEKPPTALDNAQEKLSSNYHHYDVVQNIPSNMPTSQTPF